MQKYSDGSDSDYSPRASKNKEEAKEDIFTSESAVITYFVEKYPDEEDLEENIELIFGNIDTVRIKAAKNMDKAARPWGITAELLREILQAKEKLDKNVVQPVKEVQQISVFELTEENQLLYVYIKDLIKNDLELENEMQLESLMRSND